MTIYKRRVSADLIPPRHGRITSASQATHSELGSIWRFNDRIARMEDDAAGSNCGFHLSERERIPVARSAERIVKSASIPGAMRPS